MSLLHNAASAGCWRLPSRRSADTGGGTGRGCDDDAGEIGGIDRPFSPTLEHRMAGHLAAGMADANQSVRLLDCDLGADQPLASEQASGLLGAKTATITAERPIPGFPASASSVPGKRGGEEFTALPTLDCPCAHETPQGRRFSGPLRGFGP